MGALPKTPAYSRHSNKADAVQMLKGAMMQTDVPTRVQLQGMCTRLEAGAA